MPGRSSTFMFELSPNYRGTQSQASNSLCDVIGSIDAVLLMGLFHSLKNVVDQVEFLHIKVLSFQMSYSHRQI